MRILTASWIVPVSRPPIRNGRVGVDHGLIRWVGASGDPGDPGGNVHDLGSGVLLPGLVNAHCHLELSHLAGTQTSGGFVPWVERIVAGRETSSRQAIRAAAARAAAASVASGTVAVADVSNALDHLDLLADAGLHATVFHELIGWDPARADAILADADAARAALSADLGARGIEVREAAHAPHSVSRVLFEGLRRRGGPAALHLAESPEESRFLLAGDGAWREFLVARGLGDVAFELPRTSPVKYADSLGLLRPGVVAAHCVHADADDLEILARSGVGVAICLTSNRNLGVGRPPLPEMLKAGVRLCVGTDSLASGDGVDLMGELLALRRTFPDVDPAALVRMATAGGAEALGLGDLGVLEPGRRAALVFAPAPEPPADPLEWLLSGAARPKRLEAEA